MEKIFSEKIERIFKLLLLTLIFILPCQTFATPFQVAGWIPYWRTAQGTADALAHIGDFTQISPFGFTVKSDGTLADTMNIGAASWQTLIAAARAKGVKVIPTVMWSDTDAIDKVLSNTKLRKAHVQNIINMLNAGNFDGVDIDYEGKKDSDENYFSLFLQELWNATGKRLVVCSIEPRTPLDSRFSVIPQNITYANDFVAINKYCDQVRIMTYDQGTVDLKLDKAANGLYEPIADTAWVEKVVKLAEQQISKKKIVIGVATYGHEYQVTRTSNGFQYNFLTSFDPDYALDIAQSFSITPSRNTAGELSFVYVPTSTPATLTQTGTANIGTTTGQGNIGIGTFNFVSWSDASAIADKIALAKKLGVLGIAIFKIDGGEDPGLWKILK
jgi:spore germination protein YaaH